MSLSFEQKLDLSKGSDWELDFYSRPILEADGKKRWELLITSTEELSEETPFRWEKICPASSVNSIWLAEALQDAINAANKQGWKAPGKLRCWRSSMKTMIIKAAEKVGLEVIPSRRTYSLQDWLLEREKDFYPKQVGYMSGPLAPPPIKIATDAVPLPEAVRGDAWSFASLSIGELKEAKDWPIEFGSLFPIKGLEDESFLIPGLRLFSKKRALALSGWLAGLEPVKLVAEGNQLILEAGQEDRWLVTDMKEEIAKDAKDALYKSKESANGIQFIAVQETPEEKSFAGFWMLRDIDDT